MRTDFLKRLASYFTILVYSSTVLFSAHGNAGGFYRPQMRSAVELYNKAVAVSKNNGDNAIFAQVFKFSKEDTKFVEEHLDLASPKIEISKAVILIPLEKGDPIKLQVVDLDKGEFKINGLPFKFDGTQSLAKNAERVIPLAQAKGYGFNINTLLDLLVPSAHAFEFDSKALGYIIAGVVAVVLTVGILMYMNKSNQRKADQNKLDSKNAHEQAMKELEIKDKATAPAVLPEATTTEGSGGDTHAPVN